MQGHWKGLASKYSTLGLEIALGVMLPTYVGSWADKRFQTGQTLLVLGFFLGLAHGVRVIWRVLKEANREADLEAEREQQARHRYFEERELKDDLTKRNQN